MALFRMPTFDLASAHLIFILLALFYTIHALGHPSSFASSATPSFSVTTPTKHATKRIIVKSKDTFMLSKNMGRIATKSAPLSHKGNFHVIEDSSDSDIDELLSTWSARQDVEYAVKDGIVWAVGAKKKTHRQSARVTTSTAKQRVTTKQQQQQSPNDPEFKYQWALPRVKAPLAWNTLESTTTNLQQDITVCVVDSGVDASHPDLSSNLHPLIGYNAITGSNNVSDGLQHGTHIAGILAAVGNNGYEVVGVGHNAVKVLSCKFLSDQGYGYTSSAIQCINYCLDNHVDIISNSWSGDDNNPALFDAIKRSRDQGVLFVVAAGNTATDLNSDTSFPASYAAEMPNIVVVASSDYNNKISNFSNYGTDAVHLAAPGEWILSTVPQSGTAYFSGTSMAAPFVAGAAALLLAASNKSLSYLQIKEILMSSVQYIPDFAGKVSSGGLLDISKALNMIKVQSYK